MSIEQTQPQNQVNGPFSYLYPQQFVLLTTFRKNGTGVPTPVWFAPAQGNLYVMTPSSTAKIKRLHNNSRILLAPCDRSGNVIGEQVEASGRELPSSDARLADKALADKYGILYRIFAFFQKLRKVKRSFIEITM